MSIRTLYERRFGKEVRGPADPDGAAELQLSGSDDSRGQQPTTAPSQRQAPAQFRGYLPFPSAAAGVETLVMFSALSHSTRILSKFYFLLSMRIPAAKDQHSLQEAAFLQKQAAKCTHSNVPQWADTGLQQFCIGHPRQEPAPPPQR
ncbi:TPA: hypothetical protein ACH3X3_012019 [Trebouxia sp. C0006]